MTVVLSVDIGLTGALACVDSYGAASVMDLVAVPDGKPVTKKSKKTGKTTTKQPMRLCGRGLIRMIRDLVPPGETGLLVFEDVRPRPMGNGGMHGNTMHSQGSLMRSRGVVEAVADIARLEVTTVTPATWKKNYGLIRREGETVDQCKDRGRLLAIQLFPALAHELRLKRWADRADALLIGKFLLDKKA